MRAVSRHHPTEIPNVGKNNLPELFRELAFKIGVEVGTAEGEFAEHLCKNIPDLKLYTIDPWQVHDDFKELPFNLVFEKFEANARKRLAKHNCEIIKDYSLSVVKKFKDNSLDFVYIDGNHAFPFVVMDIYEWSKKVKVGGIISGDDFVHSKRKYDGTHHVLEAVMGYTWAYSIRPWFLLGLTAKLPGLKRNTARSWFWVKQ